jgi:6-phosphogluconolactonase (cycloisomerase 2 family)/predicted SpoU family rRNA methylase
VLKDTVSGNTTTVAANAASFTIAPAVAAGSSYNVTVQTQPSSPTESCTVQSGGSGIANSNVTSVVIHCSVSTFTVGGTLTGNTVGTGLTVKDTVSGNTAMVTAGAGSFTITPAVNSGASYNVTITAQPTNPTQNCTVQSGGSGIVGANNVTSVVINCTTSTFTVGGTLTGDAVGTGLMVKDTISGNTATVTAGAGSFTITPAVKSGASYNVTITAQPTNPTQNCTVQSGGSGIVGATNVTTVVINCTSTPFTVGGTLTGDTVGTGLTVKDTVSGNTAVVTAGAASFAITPAVKSGASYNVTITAQPTNPTQNCTVQSGGSGIVGAGNVTSVLINCTTTKFTIGGTVTGLVGNTAGLVLQNNGGDNDTITNSGAFTFATPIKSNASYAVTVKTQPSGPTENCVVTGGTGSGSVTNANVTSVTVNCAGSFVYVTNGFDGANGSIAAFTIDPGTNVAGALTPVTGGPVALNDQPVAFALDPSGAFAYVTSYGTNVSNGPLPDIDTYSISAGVVTSTPASIFNLASGDTPFSIVVDPAGANAYVAYTVTSADTVVGAYPLSGGALGASPLGSPYDTGSGDTPFGLALTSTNGFLYESTEFYSVSNGALTLQGAPNLSGSSPYAFAVDPAAAFVYVTDTVNQTVTAYSYNGGTPGVLVQVLDSPPALGVASVGINPQSIAIDPLGRFLFVANQGDNTAAPVSVSGFTINGSGQLTSTGAATATGGGLSGDPVAVTVDVSGQYLYVANGDGGSVTAFAINQSTGVLQQISGSGVTNPSSTLLNGIGGPTAIAAQ